MQHLLEGSVYWSKYGMYSTGSVPWLSAFDPTLADKPAKGVIFVADPEPKHSLQQEKEMNVYVSMAIGYAQYECSAASSLKFVNTYIFQTKMYR